MLSGLLSEGRARHVRFPTLEHVLRSGGHDERAAPCWPHSGEGIPHWLNWRARLHPGHATGRGNSRIAPKTVCIRGMPRVFAKVSMV